MCEQGRLVGIVADRDIVVRYIARGSVHSGRLVAHYMTRDPVTIGPDEPLERAEALMARHQIRRVPVCDEGRLVGMITQADLARRASHEEVERSSRRSVPLRRCLPCSGRRSTMTTPTHFRPAASVRDWAAALPYRGRDRPRSAPRDEQERAGAR